MKNKISDETKLKAVEMYKSGRRIKSISMQLNNGYIMAKQLDRPLLNSETVHHIDGNRGNNDISNLQLMRGKHASGQCYKCNCCGSIDISPYQIQNKGE